jgi:hypothetical protein
MSLEVNTQPVPAKPTPCPSCGRPDLWRVKLDVSGGVDTYEMDSTGQFQLVESNCDLWETTYSCRGCGVELDTYDYEDLILELEERR